MVYHAIRKKDVQNFLKLALFITKNGNAPGVPDPKYHFFGFFSDNYKILHQFLPGFLKKHKKGHIVPTLVLWPNSGVVAKVYEIFQVQTRSFPKISFV